MTTAAHTAVPVKDIVLAVKVQDTVQGLAQLFQQYRYRALPSDFSYLSSSTGKKHRQGTGAAHPAVQVQDTVQGLEQLFQQDR